MGGLLLIVGGVLGMLLLLGFIGVRLLTAAVFSLLFLLLAPVVVLAPALGDRRAGRLPSGRRSCSRAVVSKLLFAFLLGVVLDVARCPVASDRARVVDAVVADVRVLVGAFARRHQVLAIAPGAALRRASCSAAAGHRLADAVVAPRRAIAEARAAHVRRRERALALAASREPSRVDSARTARCSTAARTSLAGHPQASEGPDLQARQLLVAARGEAADDARARAHLKRELANRRRRSISASARRQARASRRGDRRGELRLAHRGARIDEEIGRLQAARARSRPAAPARPAAWR